LFHARREDRGELVIRGTRVRWGERTIVMGIVNATPDSFSGDGITGVDAAVAHALAQERAGADIIDVGGESTRPGHAPVGLDEELHRVIPVIAALRAKTDAVISVDTFKPRVLEAAVDAGADMLNSVWGLSGELLAAAARRRVPVVIMHNSAQASYPHGVVDAVCASLATSAREAVAAGLPREHVIVDPGIGFGKTADDNLALLAHLDRVTALGYPTLIGTSRKSTIGKLTGRQASERLFGTAASVALAIAAGIDIVRVHDVASMRDVARVSDAVVRDWRPPDWERAPS